MECWCDQERLVSGTLAGIQEPLEANERVPDHGNASELRGSVTDCVVAQLQEVAELLLIEFLHAL